MSDCFVIIAGSGYSGRPVYMKVNNVRTGVSNPWGKVSGDIAEGEIQDIRIIYLSRHGDEVKVPPHMINYRANMFELAKYQPKAVVSLCSVGAIVPEDEPGTLAVPDQIIDYTWGRESSYNTGTNDVINFIDFTQPFSNDIREKLLEAADDLLIPIVDGGTYACMQGPRLETAAEVRKLAKDGCHYVGMTLMPEACLARELGLNYATICQVVNPAAGIGSSQFKLDPSSFAQYLEKAHEQSMQIALKAFSKYLPD